MMVFLLASMNFVINLRQTDDKYFIKILIKKAKALNGKVLKYIEHSVVVGVRVFLALNGLGIRDFLKKKIDKLTGGGNLCLFEKLADPYQIFWKL